MSIEHLIIPGGGSNFPILLGALRKLKKEGTWSYDKLKSIHGTSCGGLIGLIILLNPDWDDLYNYFINRPWNTLYEITPEMLFTAFALSYTLCPVISPSPFMPRHSKITRAVG